MHGLSPGMRATTRALACIAAAAALAGCASDNSGFTWGWHVVSPYTPRGQNNLRFLAEGFGLTIALALATLALSLGLGLVVALLGLSGWAPFARLAPPIRRDASRVEQEASPMARIARWRPLGTINRLYVEVFRSIPMLVMILWVFYGIPTVTGLQLSVFSAAMIAIAVCDSAFEAEIFRGGIQSIDRGQREAARSLGLQPWQELRLVVLPQAIRRILPPLGNQFVYITKISSLASVIGLGELTRKANELNVTEFRPLEIYTVLVLEYLVLILVISFFVRRLERRFGSDESQRR